MATQAAEVIEVHKPLKSQENAKVDSSAVIVAEEEKFETVSTMADLKEKAPEMYNAMMQGLGMNICREMQHHQKRYREILRKSRENAS